MKIKIDNLINNVKIIEGLILTEKYLFHITNEDNCKKILKEGYIRPLTFDGYRTSYRVFKDGEEEKGTSSFTSDPILIYEDDHLGSFEEKNIVMVFDREKLVEKGVKPAVYVDEYTLKSNYLNYMYAPEEAEVENEWRSVSKVNIKSALKFIYEVPERVYDMESNSFIFEN